MKTKDLLKKFWFVALIGVLAIVFVVMYAIDSISNKPTTIQTKQDNGQYVIYSVGDKNYTADDLYDELFNQLGLSAAYSRFERLVADKAIATTDEMQTIASNYATYLLANNDNTQLDSALKSMGFGGINGLKDYYLYSQKSAELGKQFFSDNIDLAEEYLQSNNSKIISHILVKVADVEKVTNEDGTVTYVAHPSAEEQAKLDAAISALDSTEFAEVAKEFSEDSSASNGGSLGYYDTSVAKNYVAEFSAAADPLNEGDVTEPIVSQYGYHIIRCDASTAANLLEQSVDFVSALQQTYGGKYYQYILDKGAELGIEIKDEDIRSEIEKSIAEENTPTDQGDAE